MFFPSSPPPSDTNNPSDFSLENPLDLSTEASTEKDPSAELFALFDTHFQDATQKGEMSELDLDAIADALAREQPALIATPIEPILVPEKVVPTETDIPWFNLAQKLREQNQTLIQRVVELEQVMGETKQQSQAEIRRLRNLSGELEQTHSQIQDLIQQRNIFQQESQQQRLQLEILTEQHDRTQSNLAQLERDCALLQEDNNAKTHQVVQLSEELTHSQATLAQLERNCAQLQEDNTRKIHDLAQLNSQLQELRSRLQRQQRYTLEYKTALDQSLAQSSHPTEAEPTTTLPPALAIQPWSPGEVEKDTPESLTNGAINPAPVLLDDLSAGEVVTSQLADNTADNITEPDSSETAVVNSVAAIETELLASIKDHLENETEETRLTEPEVVQKAEKEAVAFTAIRPHPVFIRSFSISPSFAINPSKKQSPPAKKVELPAFLRNH